MNKVNKQKVSFLFGSGISIELGLPSTNHITEIVLTGKQEQKDKERQIYKGSTRAFYLCSSNDAACYQQMDEESRQLVSVIVSFLNMCSSYFDNPNYEQVYELVYQIHYFLTENPQNPAMKVFVSSITPFLTHQISQYNQTTNFPEKIAGLPELCYKSIYYIESIVEQLIREGCDGLKEKDFEHFGWLQKSIEKYEVQQIATLNHDLVLETFFDKKSIEYSTGFEKINDDKSPTYQFNWKSNKKLPLLKLHGSIGWSVFQDRKVSKIIYRDIQNCDVRNGHFELNGVADLSESAQDWHSMKVMGTDSKPKKYSQSVYLDLFHHFLNYLANSDILIIAGYSFGDQAVNDYIYEQMLLNENLKIVVVHHEPTQILDNSKILTEDRVFFVKKAICKDSCPRNSQPLNFVDIENAINT